VAHLRPHHRIDLPRSDPWPGVELTGSAGSRVAVACGHLIADDRGPTGGPAVPGHRGRPALVLLHGFSFDRSSWDPQFDRFAEHYRTVRYDLRGFGESSPPVAGRGHLEDLIDLLDQLRIAQAHLIGLSLGANIALAAAVAHPDRVASAVLAAPGLPGHRWTTPRPPDEAAEYARVHGVDPGRRFWLDHEIFASTLDYPQARAAIERMVARFAGRQWTDGEQTDPLPPVHERLGEIRVPTLVVHGARDVAGYQEIARVIAAGIPGARRQEVAPAGHLVNLEQPDEFTARILDFLASVGH
jgi:3-oxoadipate enol-lactonase